MADEPDFGKIEKEIATPLIVALAAGHEKWEDTGDDTEIKEVYTRVGTYLGGLTIQELAAIVMVTAERGSDFLRALAAAEDN